MDITFIGTVAVSAVKAVVPYFKSGGEKANKTGFDKHREVWNKLKKVFEGEQVLELTLLERYPDDKDIQTEVTYLLEERLKENHALAKEFAEDLKTIPEVSAAIERILLYLEEIEKYKTSTQI